LDVAKFLIVAPSFPGQDRTTLRPNSDSTPTGALQKRDEQNIFDIHFLSASSGFPSRSTVYSELAVSAQISTQD